MNTDLNASDSRTLRKILRAGMNIVDLCGSDDPSALVPLAIEIGANVHCFEPDFDRYKSLLPTLNSGIARGLIVPQNIDLIASGIEKFCARAQLRRIDLLRIGNGIDASAALDACESLFQKHLIDYVLMPADGERFADRLATHRIELFRLDVNGPVLAVSDRFRVAITGNLKKSPFDLPELAAEFGVSIRGVIQVGAYRGENAEGFFRCGATRAILVEANPDLAKQIETKFADDDRVTTLHAAACETSGPITFRITDGLDQCSSILPLKQHLKFYPNIRESRQVTVPGLSLDDLIAQPGIDASHFNALVLDIQGAELAALRGASGSLLNHLDVILTEINYDELYEGCGQIEALDEFLIEHGFARAATDCRFHHSWGDAFYVRKDLLRSSVIESLRKRRAIVAGAWLQLPADQIELALRGELGDAHRALLKLSVELIELNADEQIIARQLSEQIQKGEAGAWYQRATLAGELYGVANDDRAINAAA